MSTKASINPLLPCSLPSVAVLFFNRRLVSSRLVPFRRLEWEQLLEHHRELQDSFDQLQAEAKFEADQARQELQNRQQEVDDLKTRLMVSGITISSATFCLLPAQRLRCFLHILAV